MKAFLYSIVIAFTLFFDWANANTQESCFSYGNAYSYSLEHSNAAEVVAFLNSNFFKAVPNDSLFKTSVGNKHSREVYFDTPKNELLKKGASLVHSVNMSLPKYKSQRESFVLKSPSGVKNFKVRNYKNKDNQYDKDLVLGKVKRSEREILIGELKSLGVELNRLSKNFLVSHNEKLFVIYHYGKPVLSFSVDASVIEDFGISTVATFYKIDASFPDYLTLRTEEIRVLTEFSCGVHNAVLSNFKSIDLSSANLEKFYLEALTEKNPSREFFKSNPYAYKILQVFFFILLFLGVGYLLRNLRRVERYSVKKNR